MKDDFKKRVWTGVGIILGSVIAAGIGMYYLSGAVRMQAAQVTSEKQEQGNDASALANLASLENDAPKALQYEMALNDLLPDQIGLITFNTWINQIAGKYGVVATVAYQGDPTPSQGNTPGNVAFAMTAQGPAGKMAPFMDDVAAKTPGFIVSFSSFDLTNNGAQDSLTAQGTVYFR